MGENISLDEVRQKTITYIFFFFASLLFLYIGLGIVGVVPLRPGQYVLNFVYGAMLLAFVLGYRRQRLSYAFIVNLGLLFGLFHIVYTLYTSGYNELRIVWFFPLLLFGYLYGGRRIGMVATAVSVTTVYLLHERLGYSTPALMTFYISDLTISVVALFFIAKFQEMSRLVAETQNRLSRYASYDYLTGVLNRRGFFETVGGKEEGMLVVLDLDRFKEVNDRHGHAVGDDYLKHLVDLLRRSLRRGDRVARFGGDEFVVLFESAAPRDLPAWFERFYGLLRQNPYRAGKVSIPLSVSAGVAPLEGSVDAALEEADRNLYRAKRERGRWCDRHACYDPAA